MNKKHAWERGMWGTWGICLLNIMKSHVAQLFVRGSKWNVWKTQQTWTHFLVPSNFSFLTSGILACTEPDIGHVFWYQGGFDKVASDVLTCALLGRASSSSTVSSGAVEALTPTLRLSALHTWTKMKFTKITNHDLGFKNTDKGGNNCFSRPS